MPKCKTCRAKDVELLTHWERLRNWLFEHVNHIFFADDFDDIKSQKYTQGYSDGLVHGAEMERIKLERDLKRYGR